MTGQPRLSPVPEPEAGVIDELTVTERRMLQALGREPTPEELAAELDLPPP
jgi:RNA polymerase primary sigma factor